MSAQKTVGATDALPARPKRVPWGSVALFVAVSFGGAWVLSVPLWRDGGVSHPNFQAIAVAIMFTPALATVLLMLTRAGRGVSLGLRARPIAPTLLASAAALLGFPVLTLAAVLLAWVLGTAELDVIDLSGYREMLAQQLGAMGPDAVKLLETVPIHLLAAGQVVNIVFNALLAAVAVFGEELGWRGWLLAALRPAGVWPALAVSGAIWGLWHAPLILLGYNYGMTDLTGVLAMTVFCVLAGVVLGWLRLRTGTIWPAVFAHAAINASVAIWLSILLPAGTAADVLTMSFLGWPGWIVLALVIAILVLTRRLPLMSARHEASRPTPTNQEIAK